jgi:hypothetical protein
MNIKIEVDRKPSDMTQAEYHRIRRMANVLRERGDHVTLIWDGKEQDDLMRLYMADAR